MSNFIPFSKFHKSLQSLLPGKLSWRGDRLWTWTQTKISTGFYIELPPAKRWELRAESFFASRVLQGLHIVRQILRAMAPSSHVEMAQCGRVDFARLGQGVAVASKGYYSA